MLLFGKDNTIIYANASAKVLLSLSQEDKGGYSIDNTIELEIHKGKREHLVDSIAKLQTENPDNIRLEEVFLIIDNKKIKVNIFLDKSHWSIDETMTCIIDRVQYQMGLSASSEQGLNNVLTGLPSQLLAFDDIDKLVIDSREHLQSFGLCLMGIDHFKDIQRTVGIKHSNHILKNLALEFMESKDIHTSVYYMESGKFLFVLKNIDENTEIREISRGLYSCT
ncbi:MAG: diguanylate cyclase [Sulfurovum sp.]|nr:diguanylate cyclase [Sulfurovum sp.]